MAAASRTPFESARRVFVIERVDELGDEAANRMLKTLEEPASFVHMILLTDRLTEVLPDDQLALSGGALRRSAHRSGRRRDSGTGRGARHRTGVRAAVARGSRAGPRAGRRAGRRFARGRGAVRPCRPRGRGRGHEAVARRSSPRSGSVGEAVREELDREAAAQLELYPRKERKRVETEWSERIRRARRRAETGALDLALQMVALWYADLAAIAWGAEELVRHRDRLDELRADAGPRPAAADGGRRPRRGDPAPVPAQRLGGVSLRGARVPVGGGARWLRFEAGGLRRRRRPARTGESSCARLRPRIATSSSR